ncbi:hypothetical protein, partial [Aeromonas caviae]|uniref:hypothetical protein n=1 Tax=Aeromonas caviae TaxID=648 RepID=UPI003EC545B4
AFSARSGFGMFLHPVARFYVLSRTSGRTRSDKLAQWGEAGPDPPHCQSNLAFDQSKFTF